MSALFKRVYTLTIGDREITGLDVSFSVDRTLRREPNRAAIRVWNLARSTRDELSRVDSARVLLEAGYESGTAVIFDGELQRITSKKSGEDWLTEIESGDGARSIRAARVSVSSRSNQLLRTSLEQCANALGVGIGNAAEAFVRANSSSRIRQGSVLSGQAEDVLTRLCDSVQLEWSVQGGVLQVLPARRALTSEAVRLTASTGLVGSPSVDSHGKLQAEALLIPQLEPGRLVSVESTHVQGTWRITRASYTGDLSGSAWGVAIEGRQEGRA